MWDWEEGNLIEGWEKEREDFGSGPVITLSLTLIKLRVKDSTLQCALATEKTHTHTYSVVPSWHVDTSESAAVAHTHTHTNTEQSMLVFPESEGNPTAQLRASSISCSHTQKGKEWNRPAEKRKGHKRRVKSVRSDKMKKRDEERQK